MKKIIKNNYLILIVSVLLFIYGFISVSSFLNDRPKTLKSAIEQQKYICLLENTEDYCDTNNIEIKNRDTFSTFMYIVNMSDISTFMTLGSPLFVIILSSFYFHKYFRKGYFKNSINRIGYKKTIINIYLKLLKCTLILPIFIILMFVVSYTISGNFDFELGVKLYGSIGLNSYYAKIWPIFMLSYILIFFLHGIFWINISVFNIKHNKYLIVSIIVSYIEFFLLAVIIELIGSSLFQTTKYLEYFNLFNMWLFHNVTILGVLLETFIYVGVTSLMVYFAYKNKEKVLEEIDK